LNSGPGKNFFSF
jgi:hypothetical protein